MWDNHCFQSNPPETPTDMTITLKQLKGWLLEGEGERLEFKEARVQFDADELTRYCVALANEHGGRILLGVNDKQQVVGSNVFPISQI